MTEQSLQDEIIKTALDLQRLSAFEEGEALKVFGELERELRQLLASADLEEQTRREVEALIKQADEAIKAHYTTMAGQVDARGIILTIAQKTVDVMAEAFPSALMPSAERLASLAKDVMIDGAPSSAWWARQAEDTTFKFAREVRQGVISGETNAQIVARVFGNDDEPGILDTSRRNVRTLVHSSIMTAANQARLATFRKNSRFSKGVRWLATLDSRTCAQCAALDGQAWDFDGNKLDGSEVDFMMPPAHFSCRCVVTPIPKGLDEIFGTTTLDAKMASPVRASKDGPTTATTMEAFLRRQPADVVEEMLGKGRAELFLERKLTISDLVSGRGRELTLTELRAR